MDFEDLLLALRHPSVYSHPVEGGVEVVQTHISVVFLAGAFAYKLKKPVDLGFVDFTDREKRLYFCHEEVRLNRRLAGEVYRGVVGIYEDRGQVRIRPLEPEGGERAIECAVQMDRLDDRMTLRALLERNRLAPEILISLARRLARFHRAAERGEAVSRWARWDVVSANNRENFEQTAPLVGRSVSRPVIEALEGLMTRELTRHRDLIEARAHRQVARDTHGDLHLGHVYHFPDREPPGDLVILDCIEFNERFRFADPIADVAFLAMDLEYCRRQDWAQGFIDAYLEAVSDPDGRALLPFYKAYRAMVRGKVDGMKSVEGEVPEAERQDALQSARAHFLLALGLLAAPSVRPCLVLVGGLPGTGKSMLARRLEELGNFVRISSDRTRKALAGIDATSSATAAYGEGIYTEAWNERTYNACRERAEEELFLGKRVLVEATFRQEERRLEFLETARRWGVPCLFLDCETDDELVRSRLEHRSGSESDAGWEIYRELRSRWQPAGVESGAILEPIRNDSTPEAFLESALAVLRSHKLF